MENVVIHDEAEVKEAKVEVPNAESCPGEGLSHHLLNEILLDKTKRATRSASPSRKRRLRC